MMGAIFLEIIGPEKPGRSGVAQRPHGGGNASIVSEVVLNSCLLLRLRVLGSPGPYSPPENRVVAHIPGTSLSRHSWLSRRLRCQARRKEQVYCVSPGRITSRFFAMYSPPQPASFSQNCICRLH